MNARAAAQRKSRPSSDDAEWIKTLAFVERKESWVAASGDDFYKIFRSSGDPSRDWLDRECGDSARREFDDMRLLHRLGERACAPRRLDHACVVYPWLSGPDLRELLLRRDAAGAAERSVALREAVSLLTQLHAATTDSISHYPLKNYLADGFLNPDMDVLRRIGERDRTLCISGFEVRNFRYDRCRGAWIFFDPQVVSRGAPENDLARFIVSLLMVNWGKGGSSRIWREFDIGDLISTYERAASRSIDPVLLNYFLQESIAMRRHFAERALRALHGVSRVFGRPYLAAYFRQLEKWAKNHEF